MEIGLLEQIGVFYRGAVLGLMIAAPVGPIGLLCIRRTIQKGLPTGFATGFGAAVADTLFASIAALGVTAILAFIQHYNVFIRILGGAFLVIAALHTWYDRPDIVEPNEVAGNELIQKLIGIAKPNTTIIGILKAFLSGLGITLTNPVTLFAVLAVVATFSDLKKSLDATTLVGGIFFGSTLWWFMLSGGIALVRNHFTENRVILINRITAIALATLAVWAIASGLHGLVGNA